MSTHPPGFLPLHWTDRGCRISPSCFECPLRACILDVPLRRQQREDRQAEIVRRFEAGDTEARIAADLGLSRGVISKAVNDAYRSPHDGDIRKSGA